MKKLVCILVAGLLSLMTSTAQVKFKEDRFSIGIGLSTSHDGCGELVIEQAVSSRWTLMISAGLKLRLPESFTDEETSTHHQEFEDRVIQADTAAPSHKEVFMFSYWPVGLREGPALSFGAEYLDPGGFDAVCGICYRIPLWKKLYADISYNLRCITPLIYNTGLSGTAGLKLYYRF